MLLEMTPSIHVLLVIIGCFMHLSQSLFVSFCIAVTDNTRLCVLWFQY